MLAGMGRGLRGLCFPRRRRPIPKRSTSGLGGFWRHAGFPFTFAWGTVGQFDHFDIVLFLADFWLGLIVEFQIAAQIRFLF